MSENPYVSSQLDRKRFLVRGDKTASRVGMRECLREIGSGTIVPLNQNGPLRRDGDIPSDVSCTRIF